MKKPLFPNVLVHPVKCIQVWDTLYYGCWSVEYHFSSLKRIFCVRRMISLSKKGGRYIGEPMWCIIMLFLHRIDVLWNEQGGRWAFLCPIIEIDFLLLRCVAALCFVLCHIHHKPTKDPQTKPNNLIVRYFFQ